jgi:hypothetical protein
VLVGCVCGDNVKLEAEINATCTRCSTGNNATLYPGCSVTGYRYLTPDSASSTALYNPATVTWTFNLDQPGPYAVNISMWCMTAGSLTNTVIIKLDNSRQARYDGDTKGYLKCSECSV